MFSILYLKRLGIISFFVKKSNDICSNKGIMKNLIFLYRNLLIYKVYFLSCFEFVKIPNEYAKVDHLKGTLLGLCDLINRQIKTNH